MAESTAAASPPWQADAVAWAAFALGAAVLAWGGAPAPSWLDSGELVAAARELGNVHPPGHPAWLSLAGLAELLPFGPYAARVAWLSALGAGAALFLTVRLGRLAAGAGSPRLQAALGAVAALVLLGSGSLWQVSVRAEVYTLALATNLWALLAALHAGRAAQAGEPGRTVLGHLAAWVAATCLGLLNHHYVALFAIPATLVAAWPALVQVARRRPRWLGGLLLGGALLGLGYLALALRAMADTEMRWGDPRTLAGLWDTVSARHFQRSVTAVDVDVVDNLLVLLGMVAEQLGPLLATVGGLGLALGVLRRDRLQAVLWLALLGGLLTKALMQIDTRNPDDHGYVLLAPAVLGVGGAQLGALLFGPNGALRVGGRALRERLAVGLLVVVAALTAVQATSLARQPATWLADLRAGDTLDSHLRATLAPGALYLANYYGLAFHEQAFRVAEGRRPDVVAAHLTFRSGDTDGGRAYQAWFARRHPELADLARAASGLGRAPIGNLLPLVEKQPVYAEQDPENRLPVSFYGFDGVAQRLLEEPERALDYDLAALRERHERTWQRLYAALGPAALADHPTRAVLLWQHALQAAHALRRGWMAIAADELARARNISPRDRLLDALQARLGALEAAWQRADTKAFQNTWQRYATLTFDELAAPD